MPPGFPAGCSISPKTPPAGGPVAGFSPAAVVPHLAVHQREQHRDAVDVVGIDLEEVRAEHDQVRLLADLDRANLVLHVELPGAVDRVGLDRVADAHALARHHDVVVWVARALARDRRLEVHERRDLEDVDAAEVRADGEGRARTHHVAVSEQPLLEPFRAELALVAGIVDAVVVGRPQRRSVHHDAELAEARQVVRVAERDVVDRVAAPLRAEPLLHGLESVEDSADRAVAVRMNMHVEASLLHRLDLSLDVLLGEEHFAPRRAVVERLQELGRARFERSVRPHLAGADLHVVGAESPVPVHEFVGDSLRVVLGTACVDGRDDADRQLARLVARDEVLDDPMLAAALIAEKEAAVHVGGQSMRRRAVDRQPLGFANRVGRRHAPGDHDRHRSALYSEARRRAVGVAHVVLLARVRIGGARVEPRRLHGRGVEPRFVDVGADEVHRTVAGDLVEPFAARQFLAEGVVQHPAEAAQICFRWLPRNPLADGVENGVFPLEPAEVDSELGDAEGRQMVVAVDEAGHQHPAGEFDDPGIRTFPCRGAGLVADVDDLIPADRHRLGGRLRGVDRVDVPVLKEPIGLAVVGGGQCTLLDLRFVCEGQRRRSDRGRREDGASPQDLSAGCGNARAARAVEDLHPVAEQTHVRSLLPIAPPTRQNDTCPFIFSWGAVGALAWLEPLSLRILFTPILVRTRRVPSGRGKARWFYRAFPAR